MPELIQRAEAFARERHKGQTRRGAGAEPYITHVEEVAGLTALWCGSEVQVAAAWLHDTVEDCPPTSRAEIEALFGPQVASIVAELTDDKSLPKAERKRLQIAHAPGKSAAACLVKLADKTSNVRSLYSSPPADWSASRRGDYLTWADTVVAELAHRPADALAAFQAALAEAKAALAAMQG